MQLIDEKEGSLIEEFESPGEEMVDVGELVNEEEAVEVVESIDNE